MNNIQSENTIGHHELKNLQYLRLRVATITRVDPAKMKVDLRYIQEAGGRTGVHLTSAYWSASSFMGVIPEVGALCIIGFYHQGADTWIPVILAYLPIGIQAARRGESQYAGLPSEGEDDIREGITQTIHGRLRKTYPGQILLQSTEGSDIVLSDDILLSNSTANEIAIRSDDGSIVANSLAHIINTPGGYTKFGPIARNWLTIDDHMLREGSSEYNIESGTPIIDTTAYEGAVAARLINPITLPNGKKINYICSLPLSPNESGIPFTEVRTEIHEYSPLSMKFTEDTDHFSGIEEHGTPVVEHVRGTLVGNDTQDPDTYGRVLKAQIFSALSQATGNFSLTEAFHSRGSLRDNEMQSEAIADYLRVGNYKKAITKTGNVYLEIPRSTQSGPLGDGHSLHASLQGAAKVSIGKENQTGTSLYLRSEGAIKSVIGRSVIDDQGEKGRSIEITTTGGVNLELNGTDSEDVSYRSTMTGKRYEVVGKDNNLTVKGNHNLVIHGATIENILGKKTLNVTGDYHTAIGGDKKSLVTGKISDQIGSGREATIISPGDGTDSDSLKILTGNRVATLILGDDTVNLTAGDIKENITAGNRITDIKTGNYDISVSAGSIGIKTLAGTVSITTRSGVMELSATGQVEIKGAIIKVNGAKVDLGALPVGGVVTSAHPCLITGTPHVGSATVKCSM